MTDRPQMTERQARDWPAAVAEAQRYVETSTISEDINHYDWSVSWRDESRPGRGHSLDAIWMDGEYVAQILMDVYGYPSVSVGETNWLHNSSDEECACEPCTQRRDEEDHD